MSYKRITLILTLALATAAGAAAAESDSVLADRIETGDRKGAFEILNRAGNAAVNSAQPDGSTPLHWAVYRVDEEMARALLDRGAKADVVNAYGSSPLSEAVRAANENIVRMLLKAGADANRANADGQTPLMLAARTGVVGVAELLLSHGANVNAREEVRKQTPLMWAAAESRVDMVAFLISHRAEVNARAEASDWGNQMTSEPRVQYRPAGGLTPLLYAARAGCSGCIDRLVRGGADIDLPNPDGMTPLMMAIDNSHYEAARDLVKRGANPHTWDWWGRTPLYVAVNMRGGPDSRPGPRPPESLALIRELLEQGVDTNHQLNMLQPSRSGNSGRFKDDLLNTGATPLLRAAQTFDVDVVKLLVAHHALVDLPNAMGVTPFMATAGIGTRPTESVLGPGPPEDVVERSIEMMTILLAAGANVNARVADTTSLTARIARPSTMTNREGQTAFYFAAEMGRVPVLEFLLTRGADPLLNSREGQTPLFAAAQAGRVPAVKFLLAHGADPATAIKAAPNNAEIMAMLRAAPVR